MLVVSGTVVVVLEVVVATVVVVRVVVGAAGSVVHDAITSAHVSRPTYRSCPALLTQSPYDPLPALITADSVI